MSLCRVEMVKFLPKYRYSVDILSYSGPSEYSALPESSITLILVMGCENSLFSIIYHEQTQLNSICCFLCCTFSLFLKDLFFDIMTKRDSNQSHQLQRLGRNTEDRFSRVEAQKFINSLYAVKWIY